MRIFVSSLFASSVIISSLYITQLILNTSIPVHNTYFVIMILSTIILSSIIAELYNKESKENLITKILAKTKSFITNQLIKGALLSLTTSFLIYIVISAIASIKNILLSINILHFICISSITIFIGYFYFSLIEGIIIKPSESENENQNNWQQGLKLALYSLISTGVITNGLYFVLEKYFPQLISSILAFMPMHSLLAFNLLSLTFTLILFIYKVKTKKTIQANNALKLVLFVIIFSIIFATITTLLSAPAITIILEQGFFALFSSTALQTLATPFLFGLVAGALSSVIVRNIVNSKPQTERQYIKIASPTHSTQQTRSLQPATITRQAPPHPLNPTNTITPTQQPSHR